MALGIAAVCVAACQKCPGKFDHKAMFHKTTHAELTRKKYALMPVREGAELYNRLNGRPEPSKFTGPHGVPNPPRGELSLISEAKEGDTCLCQYAELDNNGVGMTFFYKRVS